MRKVKDTEDVFAKIVLASIVRCNLSIGLGLDSRGLKGLCAVYEAIQARHENVILYLNKKSREVLSLREQVNNATRKTQALISYAIRSCDR